MTYEEVLLEVLCFDFDVQHPHAYLADIFATYDSYTTDEYTNRLIECGWSVAHDSYRTPLCVLEPPQITAAAVFLFAQCLAEGPTGPTLNERLTSPRPNDPDWKHLLSLSEEDTEAVSGAYFIYIYIYIYINRGPTIKKAPAKRTSSCSRDPVPVL